LRLVLFHVVLIAVFGVLLPLRKGLGFLDPVMISAYACMGILFAPPAAAAAFSKARPQTMKQLFAHTAKAVAYGEGMTLVMLIAGFETVSATHGRVLVPQLDTLLGALLLGLCGSAALALFGGWLALRFSPSVARTVLRLIFLLLLVAFLFRSARLPEIVLPGAALAFAVSLLLIPLLYREVKPE
jgi:hypothetical protein